MIDEPLQAEQQIREVVQEIGLDWILAAVDEAIAAGVSEEVGIVDRSSRESRQAERLVDITDVREVRAGSREKATRTVTKNRPMAGPERIEILLAALRRYLIDVPTVHDGLVEEINAHIEPERHDTIVRTIHFEPDLDSIAGTSLHVQVADEPAPHPARSALRTKAEEVLRDLREEAAL